MSASIKPYVYLIGPADRGSIKIGVSGAPEARLRKLVKGARVYLEGRLQLSEWTDRDGKPRHGLSIMSWHCRVSQIGRAKAKSEKPKPAPQSAPTGAPFDDDITFAPERRG